MNSKNKRFFISWKSGNFWALNFFQVHLYWVLSKSFTISSFVHTIIFKLNNKFIRHGIPTIHRLAKGFSLFFFYVMFIYVWHKWLIHIHLTAVLLFSGFKYSHTSAVSIIEKHMAQTHNVDIWSSNSQRVHSQFPMGTALDFDSWEWIQFLVRMLFSGTGKNKHIQMTWYRFFQRFYTSRIEIAKAQRNFFAFFSCTFNVLQNRAVRQYNCRL